MRSTDPRSFIISGLLLICLSPSIAVAQGTMQRPVPQSQDNNPDGTLKSNGPSAKHNAAIAGSVAIDGEAPQELVEVICDCPHQRQSMAIADSKGRFTFSFSQGLSKECVLRASLAGYRSQPLPIPFRNGKPDPKAGRIGLSPVSAQNAGLTSAADDAAGSKGRKTLDKALDKAAEGDLKSAIDILHNLTAGTPNYPSALLTLGILQQLKGDKAQAEKAYLAAIQSDPKFALPLLCAAALEESRGDMASALLHSKAAIDLNPSAFPDAYALNAIASIAAQDLAAAEKSARAGLQLDTAHQFPELEYALGMVLYSKGDRPGAVSHLQSYVDLSPDGPNAGAAERQLSDLRRADQVSSQPATSSGEPSASPSKAVITPESALAFSSVQERNAPLLGKISSYTCLESILSAQIDDRGRLKRSGDSRVDVAVFDGKEVYGDPDGKRFSDGTRRDLLGYSFSTTGLFGAIARGLIAGNGVNESPRGEISFGADPMQRYDFEQSTRAANWRIQHGNQSGSAREQGWFAVDAKSLLLRRVFVKAVDIPSNLKLDSLEALIDYEPESLADHPMLMPAFARVQESERSGVKRVSLISFDHCRAYLAESSISFSETSAAGSPDAAANAKRLPPGLQVKLGLSSPLGPALEDDRISAEVLQPVEVGSRLFIDRGAQVQGHVRVRPGEKTLVVQFDRIQTRSGWVPFYAELLALAPSGVAAIEPPLNDDQVNSLLRNVSTSTPRLTGPSVPGVATLRFSGTAAELPAGTEMVWRTEPLSPEQPKASDPQLNTTIGLK